MINGDIVAQAIDVTFFPAYQRRTSETVRTRTEARSRII